MRDSLSLKIREGTVNVPIDFSDNNHTPFPEPQYFALSRHKQPWFAQDDDNITISSSALSFHNLSRSHSGNYTITVTNFMLKASEQVGTSTSTLEVDVLCKFVRASRVSYRNFRWGGESNAKYKRAIYTTLN